MFYEMLCEGLKDVLVIWVVVFVIVFILIVFGLVFFVIGEWCCWCVDEWVVGVMVDIVICLGELKECVDEYVVLFEDFVEFVVVYVEEVVRGWEWVK